MHAVLSILSLVAFGADLAPLRIEASDRGRMVTVITDVGGVQLPQSASARLTARQGEAILTLQLVAEDGQLGAPIFGEYRRVGSVFQFQPRYRLIPEHLYCATLRNADGQTVRLKYRVPPRPPSPAAFVEQVFPSSTVLPANHLKFYIHFSQPMREGRAIFDRIHLIGDDGNQVPDPWRRTELWTEDARRLTLWIHPGRIKRGVNLREELGPVLQPNRRYRLVIDSNLLDADGQRLKQAFTKEFETIVADRIRLHPEHWRLRAPRVGTRQPLAVQFGEPLDHALSRRLLEVRDSQQRPVAGQIDVGENEASWSFVPAAPWAEEEYRLDVDPLLEDLAGNTPRRVFDTDLNAAAQAPAVLSRPFRPRRSL